MMDDYKLIKDSINNLISLQNDYLKYLESKIDSFIEDKIINDKEVEELFESLLNLFQTDKVLELFKKLGRYYYFINKELVLDYFNLYKEMYLDSDEKIKIM